MLLGPLITNECNIIIMTIIFLFDFCEHLSLLIHNVSCQDMNIEHIFIDN